MWEEKFWHFLFSGRQDHRNHYRCWLSRGPQRPTPSLGHSYICPGYYNSLGDFFPQALLFFIQSGLQVLSPLEGSILQYEDSWGREEGRRKELVKLSVAGQPTNPFIPAPPPCSLLFLTTWSNACISQKMALNFSERLTISKMKTNTTLLHHIYTYSFFNHKQVDKTLDSDLPVTSRYKAVWFQCGHPNILAYMGKCWRKTTRIWPNVGRE